MVRHSLPLFFVISLVALGAGLTVGCGDDDDGGDTTGGGTDSGTEAGTGTDGTGAETGTGGTTDSTDSTDETDPGSDTSPGTAGETGETGGPAAPAVVPGCGESQIYEPPTDLTAPGTWAVGARTTTVSGYRTEIWYPAAWGSEAAASRVAYDIREHLPDAEKDKIPDAENPLLPCDCYRDLPVDSDHGPYPVIFFSHGTAAFREQSVSQMTHWASRGFIVVSADLPQLELKDILGAFGGAPTTASEALDPAETGGETAGDTAGDTGDDLGGFPSITDKAFNDVVVAVLAGRVEADVADVTAKADLGRLGFAGHSRGGAIVGGYGAAIGGFDPAGLAALVVIPMAAGGVEGEGQAMSVVMGARDDEIVPYASTQKGYSDTAPAKRLLSLKNAGHLAFSDICAIGADKGGILQVALDNGVNVPSLIKNLATDGCGATQLPTAKGIEIVNYVSAGAFQETLQCQTGFADDLAGTRGRFSPNVFDYRETLTK